MYRPLLTIIALTGLCLCAVAQEEVYVTPPKRVKWEIRSGINASVPHLSDVHIEGIEVENVQGVGKVGLYAAVAMRCLIHRFFLQPEASYAYTHGGATFSFIEDDTEYRGEHFSFKKHSINVLLFFGYNFVQEKHYELSVHLGPQFIYNFATNYYSGSTSLTTDEDAYKINAVLGVSAHINHLSLNFRYGIDPHKTQTVNRNLLLSSSGQPVSVAYRQRVNTMSFSIGYQF